MGDIKEHEIEIRTHVFMETDSNTKSADIPYIGSKNMFLTKS